MPNMMLAQAVLPIFCLQGLLLVKCLCLKREIIQSNIHRIFYKLIRSSTSCIQTSSSGSPNILFIRSHYYTKKEDNSAKYLENIAKI